MQTQSHEAHPIAWLVEYEEHPAQGPADAPSFTVQHLTFMKPEGAYLGCATALRTPHVVEMVSAMLRGNPGLDVCRAAATPEQKQLAQLVSRLVATENAAQPQAELSSTGRLTQSMPNWQDLPLCTEEGQRIRAAFLKD